MRVTILLLFAIHTWSGSDSQSLPKFKGKDIQALERLPVLWQHYWNTHNMDSMGTLLTEDIDFVNVAGI